MLIKKELLPRAVEDLKKLYPRTKTALHYKSAFELLCAVILSAQCTDERVNKVTPVLFAQYPNARAAAKANVKDIEAIIKSTGFYRAKAKSISETAKKLIKDFGGRVPRTMEEMLTLCGVARKTANVVLSDFYGVVEGVVVDTHVKRLSFRLGLTKNISPVKIEQDLMKTFDRKYWHWLSHALIWHGRKICFARGPKCALCPLNSYCPKNGVKIK